MWALIGANLVPLVGVLFFRWEVFPIVFVFWLENVIVGAFNVLKILTAPAPNPASLTARFVLAPFFTFHYGLFCFVHGVFVMVLFGRDVVPTHAFPGPALMLETVSRLGLWWAVAGLAASHGVSFVSNYLRGGERLRTSMLQLMQQPYGRIVVLHLAILGGGFLIMALGSPWYGLALLVLLKMGLDLRAHLAERRKFAEADPAVPPAGETV